MHIGPAPPPEKEIALLCITLMKIDLKTVLKTETFKEILYERALEVRWKNISKEVETNNEGKDTSELIDEIFTRFMRNLYRSEIYLHEEHALLPFVDEILIKHLGRLSLTSELLNELKQRLKALKYSDEAITNMHIFSKTQPKTLYGDNDLGKYKAMSLQEYLQENESHFLEFKSSMLWDKGKQRCSNNKFLVLQIIKGIDSFLNSDGGILLAGIDPDKGIIGIENDFKCLKKDKNFDGWTRYLSNLIENCLGRLIINSVSVKTIPHNGITVAKIITEKHPKHVFVKYTDDKGQQRCEFYIRGLNSKTLLNSEEIHQYIEKHWNS